MEDESKKQEEKATKILGKFETPEELAKAYKELEKKLGGSVINPEYDTVEQAHAKQKKFYGKLMEGGSNLDGKLKEISERIAKAHAIPAHIADSAVATATKLGSDAVVKDNQAEVEKLVASQDAQAALVAELGSDEKINEFQARYNAGKVSAEEVKMLLAQNKARHSENSAGIDKGVAPVSQEEALIRLGEIKRGVAYYDQDDPNHAATVEEARRLESVAFAGE